MRIIGLTGGIGSGKSTVAAYFSELGATIIDADKIGHEVLETDEEVQRQLIDAFGKRILSPDGKIDRRKLAGIVFGNRESLIKLNLMTHPSIYRRMQSSIEEYKRQGKDILIIDAPLLIEAGWATRVDKIWVTIAPLEVILKRLEKNGISQEEAQARINLQTLPKERIRLADLIINTDLPLEELKIKIGELWEKLRFDTC
ncbi:MAG: dephospho-CoA kinase [Dehalococcoidales bacterium]|nr:dephospho-CoA kinase [Dehalococcoidales bacterium]